MNKEPGVQTTKQIQQEFIDYFQENNHLIIEGKGIVPINDPTLLFINSGMAPLKPYFKGEAVPPAPMLANSQLCIRTTDIESVGDPHHGTSFRMLGNWSFGAYGRAEAIDYAVNLLTNRYCFSLDKLFATVFESDETTPRIDSDAASELHWRKYLPKDRILSCGPEDNLWGPAGETGPCGPCTEVFYDRGEAFGAYPTDTERGIEIWNAGVFMEYDKLVDGSLENLATMCVDAGAGLERFAMILQEAPSIHQIDQYAPAYQNIKDLVNASDNDARVVFDHMKTSQILAESGVFPDKKGGGYVLRRLIRRSLATLDLNGAETEKLFDVQKDVREVIDTVPDAIVDNDRVIEIFNIEMKSFTKVLRTYSKFIGKVIQNGEISAGQAFDATATLGIPLDLIKDACKKHTIYFPEAEYAITLAEHKALSRMKKV